MRYLAILACLWLACQPIPSPNPPPQPDADAAPPMSPPDAAAPVLTGSQCAQFCAVLDWLGCPEGRPTPKGEPCSDVCDAVTSFPNLKLPTAQIIKCRDIACVQRAGVKCGAR